MATVYYLNPDGTLPTVDDAPVLITQEQFEACCCALACQWRVKYTWDCELENWASSTEEDWVPAKYEDGTVRSEKEDEDPEDPCTRYVYGEHAPCDTSEEERPDLPPAPPAFTSEESDACCLCVWRVKYTWDCELEDWASETEEEWVKVGEVDTVFDFFGNEVFDPTVPDDPCSRYAFSEPAPCEGTQPDLPGPPVAFTEQEILECCPGQWRVEYVWDCEEDDWETVGDPVWQKQDPEREPGEYGEGCTRTVLGEVALAFPDLPPAPDPLTSGEAEDCCDLEGIEVDCVNSTVYVPVVGWYPSATVTGSGGNYQISAAFKFNDATNDPCPGTGQGRSAGTCTITIPAFDFDVFISGSVSGNVEDEAPSFDESLIRVNSTVPRAQINGTSSGNSSRLDRCLMVSASDSFGPITISAGEPITITLSSDSRDVNYHVNMVHQFQISITPSAP